MAYLLCGAIPHPLVGVVRLAADGADGVLPVAVLASVVPQLALVHLRKTDECFGTFHGIPLLKWFPSYLVPQFIFFNLSN